ncbi:hypothetical protein M2271_004922 [Streptomyces sp. LBL]|uniref:SCO2102 family sporulation regulator n=1 Tax=Streptomyces sp. LBL TaxID=2940562 RepID=UPI00247354F8|nr:hypothetical protein [Streptomyces sp. LBL]MDH6627099.1 hypothetical protein [Streptomyces sp. LBL]
MGLAVLYIAFGGVALWLLGEVLLQYKARLRWRLLAFAGFLGVVFGVLIPSVLVIALGAVAFAVGQTYVTLSFRRGFAAGWAVSRPGADGTKRRRGPADRQDPTLQVTDLGASDAGNGDETDYRPNTGAFGHDDEYDRDDVFTPARPVGPAPADPTAVYEPQPLPDETGTYGVYGSGYASHGAAGQGQSQGQYANAAADPSYSYDGYTGYDQQQYGYDMAGQQQGQQQYAAHSDPYLGAQSYDGAGHDASYGGQQPYGQQGYGQDQYGTGTYSEAPGGVWVPQQRSTDDLYGELPPEQQQYGQQGYDQNQGRNQGNGLDEQHRF